MYKKILVPLGLEHGHGYKAMEVARNLLSEGGEIVAIHVIEPAPKFVNNYLPEGHKEEVEKKAMAQMRERTGDSGDVEAEVVYGHPGRLIPSYAEKVGADCIVIGSHKADIGDFFLGSTAARVVRYAPCPVHVLR